MKPSSTSAESAPSESVLRAFVAAAFLIFFQAFMVAPLIPSLATLFHVSEESLGRVVPVYMIPYGLGSLALGFISDRLGLRRIVLRSLAAFVLLTALTATSRSAGELLAWRALTGACACGVVPLGLVWVGKTYPPASRGRPMGWVFGAMAGGMAFGSTFGALLSPWIGFRGLFLGVALLGAGVFLRFVRHRHWLSTADQRAVPSLSEVAQGYRQLLSAPLGARTYAFVFVNGVFHSGTYTWLGVLFARHYGLDEARIGLALLSYGVPGFLLGPLIGRLVDRFGRSALLPLGFFVAGASACALGGHPSLAVACIAVGTMSLGYDLSQPLLAGLVTVLGGERKGLAMGLNVFTLFVGSGVGSLLFGRALRWGFTPALLAFAVLQLAASLLSLRLFSREALASMSAASPSSPAGQTATPKAAPSSHVQRDHQSTPSLGS